MERHDRQRGGRRSAVSARQPVEHDFLSGDGWSVREVVCAAGPSDRAFEERHADFSISAVIEGVFTYRSDLGRALLYPGALLLGNSGECFECGHEHGVGDRCVSLHVREDLFAEIASTSAAASKFRFAAASLAPSTETAAIFASIEATSSGASAFRCEEIVLGVVEALVEGMSGERHANMAPTGVEARRVIDCMRFMATDLERPIRLRDLAARAGLSKYHFLRVFRRLAGVTPHQYLLGARLRRAARGLTTSRRPVVEIALDCGFGDLSTFNHHFRRAFGKTPTRYRTS
jgi:AraC-like DNA-binding protein